MITQPEGLRVLLAHSLIGAHIASVNALLHPLSTKRENSL